MPKKSTTLFGIPLYNGTYREFFQKIEHPEKKTLVFTPNPEIFVRASRDSEFMEILSGATYNVPDANGLYVGYMMREGKSFFASALRTFFCKTAVRDEYGELIKGSDLTRDVLEGGKVTPKKILIIDRKNAVPKNDLERKKAEIQKDLKNILENKYPGIEVFVVFDSELSIPDMAKLIEDQSIDFVFSCIGMKNQEKRLLEVFAHLGENQKVVGLGVGASIDFLLGLQKRAPIIFQRLGLEWLYRLITQPRIRARRIWDAVYHFQKLIKNTPFLSFSIFSERVSLQALKHPDQMRVQKKFLKDIQKNLPQYISQYEEKHGNIINTDEARELSSDYSISLASRSYHSVSVHEIASTFTKLLYQKKISENIRGDILFMAGGTGSGKTSAVRGIGKEIDIYDIVYDTNMNTLQSSKKKIEQALRKNMRITVIFIYRDIYTAFSEGMLPRAERSGRSVPIYEHIRTHLGSFYTMRELIDFYRGNEDIVFECIDNSYEKGGERIISFSDLEKKIYFDEEKIIHQRLINILEDSFSSGKISERVYNGVKGT